VQFISVGNSILFTNHKQFFEVEMSCNNCGKEAFVKIVADNIIR